MSYSASFFTESPRTTTADGAVGVWLVDTNQTPALGVMELVPNHSAATLLPVIQQHVRPGSIVWSDDWAAYRRVQQLPPVTQHQTVNHSIEFVNPTTGFHTQNVESYWNRVKTKFKTMKGVQEGTLSSYLDEFMWRECHGRTGSTALQNLCKHISMAQPV